MAEQIIKHMIDDIDGSPARVTRRFSIGGTDYVIDLSDVHSRQLTEAITPFIECARKVRRQAPHRQQPSRYERFGTTAARTRNAEIRTWARERGYRVSSKGAIPARIKEEFEAAEQRQEFNRREAIRETAAQYAETNPGPTGRSLIQQARASIGDYYKQ